MNKKELHLIVLWHNARFKEREILQDISKHVNILECYEIEWNKNNVANNFTRFYGVKLGNGSVKEKECGVGSFLLITVVDENPIYDFVETSRGYEYVNINLFELKNKYRDWTNGGHKIHTTNSVKETNHDLTLLLGINYDDYLSNAPLAWNGEFKFLKQDLAGCNGWNSFKELFYVLNATSNYIMLRGNLDKIFYGKPTDDIDILTDDYYNICFIINGIPEVNDIRPHYLTKIADGYTYLDIWNTNNDYYDSRWTDCMFQTKTLTNGIYRLDNKNSFYEFIYHCLIHKQRLDEKYFDVAKETYLNAFNKEICDSEPIFDTCYNLLTDFMKENGYSYIKPNDNTVFFNKDLISVNTKMKWFENNYFIKHVKPYKISDIGGSGCEYFTGYIEDNKVFIKSGGFGRICVNEYDCTKTLYNANPKNFLKPYFYKYDGDIKNIVIEFLEGKSLETLIYENELSEVQKQTIINDLENIARTLISKKIVHRDITLHNLILDKNGNLKLIDPQFAVYYDNYSEDAEIFNNPSLISHLGQEFAPGQYVWDDMYSISKIIALFGGNSDFVNENIGKRVIRFDKRRANTAFYKNFWERLFSAKNYFDNCMVKRKAITVLGIRFNI